MQRAVRSVLKPSGVVIVFLGSDGSGKSSVIDGLKVSVIRDVVLGIQSIHLRPHIGLKAKQKNITNDDPHGQGTRNQLSSLLKIAYFFFDYTAGYLFKIRTLLVHKKIVIFDRYYHDLLVDPKRYRYGGSMWIAQFVGRIIPKPDLFIILDAPAIIIQARKQEVPLEETHRQRVAYLKFADERANAIVVNTNQSLEDTISETTLAVLKYLQKRQEKG